MTALNPYYIPAFAIFFFGMLVWAAWDSFKDPPDEKPKDEPPPRINRR